MEGKIALIVLITKVETFRMDRDGRSSQGMHQNCTRLKRIWNLLNDCTIHAWGNASYSWGTE